MFACASTPEMRAFASSVRNVPRPRGEPSCSARSPNRTVVIGCRGTRSSWFPVKSTRPSRCVLKRSHHRAPCAGVTPEPVGGALQIAPRDRRAPAVQRLGEGDLGHDPLDALAQPERAEERRGQRGGVHGRADVVAESGEGQLRRAHSAADRAGRLDDTHAVAGAGQGDSCR